MKPALWLASAVLGAVLALWQSPRSTLAQRTVSVERAPAVSRRAGTGVGDANELERALREVALESRDRGEDLGAALVPELKRNPAAAMAAIRGLVPTLPVGEFTLERAAFIDLATELPGQGAAAKSLAVSELMSNVIAEGPDPATLHTDAELNEASRSTHGSLVPLVAHAAFLRVESDLEECLRVTIEAIERQPNRTVRESLARQLLRQHPALFERLARASDERGLALEAVAPESRG